MRRALILWSPASVSPAAPGRVRLHGEGFIDVPGGRVWYRVVGSGSGTPLLLLHGGPGVPSYYLKPLMALADERPVIFYDQLGCGHSDRPADSTLWTIDRYVEELDQVRRTLGLSQVHLLGHSWGTILANEYVHRQPRRRPQSDHGGAGAQHLALDQGRRQPAQDDARFLPGRGREARGGRQLRLARIPGPR